MSRIILKVSGEALLGEQDFGIDYNPVQMIANEIAKAVKSGVQVAVVVGGGNIFRGMKNSAKLGMDRASGDYVGMLATVMNSLVLKDAFLKIGCSVYNQSGLSVIIIDDIDSEKAKNAINDGKIVIFGGGTGKPFFSTDTGASLRAIDIGANVIVKLTNVDGVYDKDPRKYTDFEIIKETSHLRVIKDKLKVNN